MTTGARPNSPLIGGQYSRPTDQSFKPSAPAQYGHAQPIPNTNQGVTAQRTFHKLNHALSLGRPLAKIIIGAQQARF